MVSLRGTPARRSAAAEQRQGSPERAPKRSGSRKDDKKKAAAAEDHEAEHDEEVVAPRRRQARRRSRSASRSRSRSRPRSSTKKTAAAAGAASEADAEAESAPASSSARTKTTRSSSSSSTSSTSASVSSTSSTSSSVFTTRVHDHINEKMVGYAPSYDGTYAIVLALVALAGLALPWIHNIGALQEFNASRGAAQQQGGSIFAQSVTFLVDFAKHFFSNCGPNIGSKAVKGGLDFVCLFCVFLTGFMTYRVAVEDERKSRPAAVLKAAAVSAAFLLASLVIAIAHTAPLLVLVWRSHKFPGTDAHAYACTHERTHERARTHACS